MGGEGDQDLEKRVIEFVLRVIVCRGVPKQNKDKACTKLGVSELYTIA